MRLSVPFSHLEERFGAEKAFLLIKEAGIDATDYSLTTMEKDDSVYNGEGWQEKAAEIRTLADQIGVEINQIHAPFSFPKAKWEDPVYFREVLMERFKRSLRIAGIFGAATAVVHPLHYDSYVGREEAWFEKNMEYYTELLPVAEEAGVMIATENMWRTDPRRKTIAHDTCSRKEEFVRYVDSINSKWFVACLDVGHVGLVPQTDEPWDFVHALGHDRLRALHIHDNDYRGDLHKLPYTGIINWTEVARALGEIDYQGDFTYETNSLIRAMDDEFLPVGLKFTADVGRHIMSLIDRNRPQK